MTPMSNLVSHLKKAAVGAAAVLALSTGATVVSTENAQAQWGPRAGWGGPGYHGGYRGAYRGGYRPAYRYGYRGYRGYRPYRGAAVAAGLIGGIAAGALIAGAAQPAYAAPAYGYVPSYSPTYYQPAYEGFAPAYPQNCYFKKVRQVVDHDTVVIRRVRICD
jgi:hypothetical protein